MRSSGLHSAVTERHRGCDRARRGRPRVIRRSFGLALLVSRPSPCARSCAGDDGGAPFTEKSRQRAWIYEAPDIWSAYRGSFASSVSVGAKDPQSKPVEGG